MTIPPTECIRSRHQERRVCNNHTQKWGRIMCEKRKTAPDAGTYPKRSMELAINNSKNKKNQDRNDRYRDYPIRSHPNHS